MSSQQLARQWAILKRIPLWGGAISVDELAASLMKKDGLNLAGRERASYVRKVQRDIAQLREVVEFIEVQESMYGYRISWAKNAPPLKVSALRDEEVLAFGVLQKFGTDLLPQMFLKSLEPFFMLAQKQAAQREGVGVTVAGRWLSKVARKAEGPGFLPPPVDDAIVMAVHESIMEECPLQMSYRDRDPIVVYPRGVVLQGVRTYLLATPRGSHRILTYMLHRITSVKKLAIGTFEADRYFDLDAYLNKGIAKPVFDVAVYGELLKLTLWVHEESRWLEETPLAEDQSITDVEGGFQLEATVRVTEELIRWILSMSHHVKVLGPAFIAERVQSDLRLAVNRYSDDVPPDLSSR